MIPVVEIVVGVAASGVLGVVGLVGKRILTKVDTVDAAIRGNGRPDNPGIVSRLAVIESKLPNGEWREIKSSLEDLHGAHAERVTHDIREHAAIRASVSAVHEDIRAHAKGEEDRTLETIRRVLSRRKNYTRGGKSTR